MTTLESFRLFLDGIKKERTTVVSIDYWNRLMNECQLEWLAAVAPATEVTQAVIDALAPLRIATDGQQTYNGHMLSFIPSSPVNSMLFPLPVGGNLLRYPRYFRMLNVQFFLSYYDSLTSLYLPVEALEYARVLRSDKRAVTSDNYYRRARKGRLYYEQLGSEVRCVSETLCQGKAMRLEYLRVPERIWLDESNLPDHTTGTGTPYAAGYGSIPCELSEVQVQQIVDAAVRKHLERTMDPRLQSFVQEQQL